MARFIIGVKSSLSPQGTTKSINKRRKQKILASNMNTKEISIYIYIYIRVVNCSKAPRAPKKKKKSRQIKQEN